MTLEPSFSDAWYETFGRPDDTVTAREVAFLLDVLPPPPATVLDVACGSGRHARALLERGYRVTGVELEPRVGVIARAAGVTVHELDMRALRELEGTFDAVMCMWASFGWFDEATNADVFAQMAERTASNGALVLDVYDPSWFRAHQGQHILERGGRRTEELKHVVGARLFTTLDYGDGHNDDFSWQLYEPHELVALGETAELTCETICAGFDVRSSPRGEVARMQAVFRRPGTRLDAEP